MADDDDAAIMKEAKARFERCVAWESKARQNAEHDAKFANGDSINLYQWTEGVQAARGDRPMLTQNKCRQHNLQIINDARQHKAAIKVTPTGGGATFEAAQVFSAIVRRIEYQSKAIDAYSTAIYHQVESGIGYVRVCTDYVDEKSFDQEIYIKRVKDPRCVYLDVDAQDYDKGDMRFAFWANWVPKKEFEAKYPKIDAVNASLAFDFRGSAGELNSTDHVLEAEYWRRGERDDTLYELIDGSTVRAKDLPPGAEAMLKEQRAIKRERKVSEPEIEWFMIAGNEIVDRKVWPGRYIPIVPFIGEETVIDGIMDRKGHTRCLIDAQRMYNYWTPLALNTPLPTPSGWTTMGAVGAGDWLLDEKGKPVQVVGVSPTHIGRKCYRIEFDDGSHIIADGEHRWSVEERGKRQNTTWQWSRKIITTAEMEPAKHFIDVASLDLPAIDLPIDPYVLGVWLGDGATDEARITAGRDDADEMIDILSKCGCRPGVARYYGTNPAATITLHGVRPKLREMGLLGNKHIPAVYLRASHEQRLALLQGLMDTDGSVAATKQCSLTTTVSTLARDFGELLRTLGIKAVSCARLGVMRKFPNGNTYKTSDNVQFSFTSGPEMPLFRLARKAAQLGAPRNTHWRRTKRHRIVSVTEVSSVPVKCVTIDSDSHLFLAGDGMVPTHNSAAVEFVALQGKSPYIGSVRAIEGYEDIWKQANTTNLAILPYNDIDDTSQPIAPPQRSQPPVMAQAYIEGMTIAKDEMMLVSGQYQAQMGANGNEVSGVAIGQRQRQSENATAHYTDNQAKGIRQVGRIVIDLIPKIYDVARVIKIMAEDGMQSDVHLDPDAPMAHQHAMPPAAPGQPPQPITPEQAKAAQDDENSPDPTAIFNPRVGAYDIEADVGPSYATQREESFNAFSQIMAQNKEAFPIVGDFWAASADFPGADDLAKRLRRGLPPQYKAGPDPQVQQMQQLLQQTHNNANQVLGQADAQIASLKAEITRLQEQSQEKAGDLAIKDYSAETDRLKAVAAADPAAAQVLIRSMLSQLLGMPALPVMHEHQAADAEHMQSIMPPEPQAQPNGAMQ